MTLKSSIDAGYELVQTTDGSVAWRDQDGDLFALDAEEQRELRIANLEQAIAQQDQQLAQQWEQPQEEGITQDQWNEAVVDFMVDEQRRLGRELSPAEQTRISNHVLETNEFPEPTAYKANDLDTEDGRQSWMREMAMADAPDSHGPADAPTNDNAEGE